MNALHSGQSSALVLRAATAEDLMTRNPVSIRDDATLESAAAFLIEKEISAAPVVDDTGRAVGVLSHTDIVRHDAHVGARPPEEAVFYREIDCRCPPALREFIYGERAKTVRVRDVMSPVVIHVSKMHTAMSVVARLLALKIHRLFVVDDREALVGVISTFDILRCLHKD
jgi:CBS domain-containing protein